ncbi:MAG: hypothetical protein A3F83_12925 [Candidatus Glassbacteria bacterium RIFCSPLOWO2_12_FULL_58_11]|uniref:Uncharacterized protein n=1 Tax=Candidatus Glassbacteria bacterium RIFCSPLOWO2_12_FULL_58_11 TaxID=1817867 RepID=A0A1F5YZE6_9BACT|nr:MAG: hypothetical protein A3F83_12925 [Candidatus Glassbacteria bacterium RIFCSPLOWO2_12_FULL_58_11]
MGITSENSTVFLEHAAAVLDFLPVFENPDFVSGRLALKPGELPLWNYNDKLLAFIKVLYDNRWITDFDWTEWQAEARKYWEEPGLIAEADVTSLRRLLTLHVRKDRFCDGHLAAAVEQGQIAAILKRIAELKESSAFKSRPNIRSGAANSSSAGGHGNGKR